MTISAVILAGGQGRRFDHQDKGLIEWRGRWLIQHVIDRLAPQTDQIIISCNRNQDIYQTLGLPLVKDKLAGYQGPLAGIDSAIEQCSSDYLFICPCDNPLVSSNIVSTLYEALHNNSADMAVAHDGNRLQYLVALWDLRICQKELSLFLHNGGTAVKDWYKTRQIIEVDCSSQASQFINVNFPEDLHKLDCD